MFICNSYPISFTDLFVKKDLDRLSVCKDVISLATKKQFGCVLR